MRSSTFSSFRGLLAMAALGMASAASPGGLGVGTPLMPVTQAIRPAANKSVFRKGTQSASTGGYPNGPGWSHAKVKRMAKKRRNVVANRKNHRG